MSIINEPPATETDPVLAARTISTTSPLAGGGNLSADRTFSIANAAADGATKGAAAFNSTNFTAASGVVNTIQDIAAASSPTFLKITLTQVTGTAPFTISSTTICTNLNADLVDGRHVGTSGATIPILNAANTWSAAQTFGTTTLLNFRDTGISLGSSIDGTLDIIADTILNVGSTVTTLNVGNTAVTTANFGTGATTVNFGPQADVIIGGFGLVTINEAGGDFDTRIESNDNANAIFVDATANRVGIMQGSPAQVLDVVGNVIFGVASGAAGSRIIGRGEHTSAPAGTLNTGEWEISVYDNGATPVVRFRYNDAGAVKTIDAGPLV